MDEKLTWLPTCQHFFASEVLRRSSFLGNLKLSDKKLGHWRTPTQDFLSSFSILSGIPIIATNNLTSVKSDGRESTGNVASPEARSCFHRP